MKLNEYITITKSKLKEHGINESEARLLISEALKMPKEKLLIDRELTIEEKESIDVFVEKRISGIPFAYIANKKEFMKLDFYVDENVLIPRDDTEILVEKVMEFGKELLQKKSSINILDMCTGSGCIAISLEKYLNANVYAVDKSSEAIKIAKKNAKANDVKVIFIESDLFDKLDKNLSFDIIVSNPPYIKSEVINSLQSEVKDNEPQMALDGGKDGLDFYRKISEESKIFLVDGGYLAFEIGYDQADEVIALMEQNEYKDIQLIKDYSGNDRVIFGKK